MEPLEIIKSNTYEEYVRAQRRKYQRKKRRVFVRPIHLRTLAAVILEHGPSEIRRGLCHGVRTGYECRKLSWMLGIPVGGTDIGPAVGEYIYGERDFHAPVESWIGQMCFVYSNSLDHSDRPRTALGVWSDQLRDGGLLCLHWSKSASRAQDKADCFGASLETYEALVSEVATHILTQPCGGTHHLVVGRKPSEAVYCESDS